jgi:Spy/CpxP family protein refolding chaperone
MLILTVLAAAGAGWFGVHYANEQAARASTNLDELLHHELDLSADQRQRLAALEQGYAGRRRPLEDQMRAANHALAKAIVNEHRYGPQARQAIENFHAAMQTLQEETIQHILAMRAVLTPEQARRFDQTVAKALDSDQP